MTANEEPNIRLPSTTFEWRRVKIRRPPEASSASPQAATKWWHLSRWNGRQKLTVTITYRGGAECWYEVHARGASGRFPGVTQLHDVMDQVYGGERRGGRG